jgi:hypothetical protein
VQLSLNIEENPLMNYYVDNFLVEPIIGQNMIHSTPFLPLIDIMAIKLIVSSISYYFDEKEIELNTLKQYPFEYCKGKFKSNHNIR